MRGLLLGEATSIDAICYDAAPILKLVGWVLTVFKIAIPLIIIALGVVDLASAAISSKPEEMKKSITSLAWRLVGGIAIFFIPTLVMLVFGFISDYRKAETGVGSWDICYSCVVSPWDSTCSTAADRKSADKKFENCYEVKRNTQTNSVELTSKKTC